MSDYLTTRETTDWDDHDGGLGVLGMIIYMNGNSIIGGLY
jgi:hypothetical protein